MKAKTYDSYIQEWRQYLRFARKMWSTQSIPGKDTEWNAFLLWKYLLYRAEKCKPTTVFSADNGEFFVFAPEQGRAGSRARRKAWLQESLLVALHPHDIAVRNRVALVSPHAFRAGLASDLLRSGVAPQTITIWCRWWSMRAMRMYADRQELCFTRTSVDCRLFNRTQ